MASSWFVKMILVKKFKLVNTPMDKREIHIANVKFILLTAIVTTIED